VLVADGDCGCCVLSAPGRHLVAAKIEAAITGHKSAEFITASYIMFICQYSHATQQALRRLCKQNLLATYAVCAACTHARTHYICFTAAASAAERLHERLVFDADCSECTSAAT
jgi:hypothetical protein